MRFYKADRNWNHYPLPALIPDPLDEGVLSRQFYPVKGVLERGEIVVLVHSWRDSRGECHSVCLLGDGIRVFPHVQPSQLGSESINYENLPVP